MGAPGIAAIEKYPSRGQHAWPDPVPGQDDNLDIGTCSVSRIYMPRQLPSSLWTSRLGVSSVSPQTVANRDLLSLNDGSSCCHEELWSTCKVSSLPVSSLLAVGDPGTGAEGLRQIKSWLCHGPGKGKCNIKTREGLVGDFSLVCGEL